MIYDVNNAVVEKIYDDLFEEKEVKLSILRLDLIHPIVSGNKLFKLHYFLQDLLDSQKNENNYNNTILTFGGAFSNHLAATAYACNALQIKCIGIVRGKKPPHLSPTLKQCETDGMQLHFISKLQYEFRNTKENTAYFQSHFGKCMVVPEGGYHPIGAAGAALIRDLIPSKKYTHICTATGTATTLAGLLKNSKPGQKVISVPVVKGMIDIAERLKYLTGSENITDNLEIIDNYQFGGYAKKDEVLINFMNQFWSSHNIPLDFVYTAKMMYAIIDSIKNNYFKKGSEILCLHTGGLQGNKSLPLKTLLY